MKKNCAKNSHISAIFRDFSKNHENSSKTMKKSRNCLNKDTYFYETHTKPPYFTLVTVEDFERCFRQVKALYIFIFSIFWKILYFYVVGIEHSKARERECVCCAQKTKHCAKIIHMNKTESCLEKIPDFTRIYSCGKNKSHSAILLFLRICKFSDVENWCVRVKNDI